MSIFKKRKDSVPQTIATGKSSVVVSMHSPFSGCLPPDYLSFFKLNSSIVRPYLDQVLKTVFDKNGVDAANGNMLDRYFTSLAEEAYSDLLKQKNLHEQNIINLCEKRDSNKIAFEIRIEKVEKELETYKKELQRLVDLKKEAM